MLCPMAGGSDSANGTHPSVFEFPQLYLMFELKVHLLKQLVLDTLEETLSRNDLLDKPGQVFNMDETGVTLDPKSMKAIAEKGMKDPSYVSSGHRSLLLGVFVLLGFLFHLC